MSKSERFFLTADDVETLKFDPGEDSSHNSLAGGLRIAGVQRGNCRDGQRGRPRSSQSSRRGRNNPCDLGPGRADGRRRRRSPGRPEDRSGNFGLRPREPLSFDCEHWGRSHDGIRGLFPGGRGASAPLASWVSNIAATAMNGFDCLRYDGEVREQSRILARLRAQISDGKPIVGAGGGTGISAKCAELGAPTDHHLQLGPLSDGGSRIDRRTYALWRRQSDRRRDGRRGFASGAKDAGYRRRLWDRPVPANAAVPQRIEGDRL